jgi:hypothetical protein
MLSKRRMDFDAELINVVFLRLLSVKVDLLLELCVGLLTSIF